MYIIYFLFTSNEEVHYKARNNLHAPYYVDPIAYTITPLVTSYPNLYSTYLYTLVTKPERTFIALENCYSTSNAYLLDLNNIMNYYVCDSLFKIYIYHQPIIITNINQELSTVMCPTISV